MSDHHFDGHFPEEAEQNEIGGPVVVALMILPFSVLLMDSEVDYDEKPQTLTFNPNATCLLNIAGKLKRRGSRIQVRHVAEILTGYSGPAIGDGRH